jgi:hypothetical protein
VSKAIAGGRKPVAGWVVGYERRCYLYLASTYKNNRVVFNKVYDNWDAQLTSQSRSSGTPPFVEEMVESDGAIMDHTIPASNWSIPQQIKGYIFSKDPEEIAQIKEYLSIIDLTECF